MPLLQLIRIGIQFILDVLPYLAVASFPIIAGTVAAYFSAAYRENIMRGAGKIALSFVTLTALLGVYFLTDYVISEDPYWPDLVGFVALYGLLLVLFVGVYTLASSAVGLKAGAYLKSRRMVG